jgi:predicted TIM-barrel fold metal-dependent hydrolase
MTMLTLEERPRERVREERTKLRVVDCDIHPAMNSWTEVHPFLEKRWIDHLSIYGSHLRHAFSEALSHPRMSPDAARVDAYPEEGGPPGSSLELMREQHLDANGVEKGVLIPLRWNPGSQRNLDFGAALSHAMNSWQAERWVASEERLRASILVSQEDTVASVKEIELRARDPRFVQVLLLPRTDEPLGRRRYWPILEAAARNNLPVAIHVGGTGGHPSTGGGWPSYYMEEHHAVAETMQAVVVSLVVEGVFGRFPQLRVVIMEGGLGWIPSLSARLDKHWARLRSEVPHLTRKPSDYIREHLWFTTQPMEEPESASQLSDLFDRIGWDRLLFSTDYPHWDFDDPRYAFKMPMSDAQRDQLLFSNAQAFYGFD